MAAEVWPARVEWDPWGDAWGDKVPRWCEGGVASPGGIPHEQATPGAGAVAAPEPTGQPQQAGTGAEPGPNSAAHAPDSAASVAHSPSPATSPREGGDGVGPLGRGRGENRHPPAHCCAIPPLFIIGPQTFFGEAKATAVV